MFSGQHFSFSSASSFSTSFSICAAFCPDPVSGKACYSCCKTVSHRKFRRCRQIALHAPHCRVRRCQPAAGYATFQSAPFQSCRLHADCPDAWAPRAALVSGLCGLIRFQRIVQIRGTPASGKTTLRCLLECHIATTDPEDQIFVTQGWNKDTLMEHFGNVNGYLETITALSVPELLASDQCCTRLENSRRESRSCENFLVSKDLASLNLSRLHWVTPADTKLWQTALACGGSSGQRL
jgi:hypothetical protein